MNNFNMYTTTEEYNDDVCRRPRPSVSFIKEEMIPIYENAFSCKFVDMGLREGNAIILVADRNLGADSVNDAGKYFQYGKLTPHDKTDTFDDAEYYKDGNSVLCVNYAYWNDVNKYYPPNALTGLSSSRGSNTSYAGQITDLSYFFDNKDMDWDYIEDENGADIGLKVTYIPNGNSINFIYCPRRVENEFVGNQRDICFWTNQNGSSGQAKFVVRNNNDGQCDINYTSWTDGMCIRPTLRVYQS